MTSRSLVAAALTLLAPFSVLSAVAPAHAASELPAGVWVRDAVRRPDGKTLVALAPQSGDRFMLVRLQADGTLDPSFDGDGNFLQIGRNLRSVRASQSLVSRNR